MRPAPYHRLSFGEKRARSVAMGVRPVVACPACGIQTEPCDLLRHLEGSCPRRAR